MTLLRKLGETEFLWAIGLGYLLVLLAETFLPLSGKSLDWAVYLILGSLYPAILLVLARASRSAAPAFLALQGLLTLAAAGLLVQLFDLDTLLAGLGACAGLAACAAGPLLPARASRRERIGWFALAFGAMLLTWVCTVHLEWWAPKDDWFGGARILLTLGAVALAATGLGLVPLPGPRDVRWVARARDLVALACFALLSLRTDGLFERWDGTTLWEDNTAWAHWGVFTGPAQVVREGGWLLWDTPSQYGFLNVLVLAGLPTSSTWQSLYVMDAVLLLASGILFYLLVRRLGSGWAHWLLCLLLTISAVYLLPGAPPVSLGPHVVPSVGAMRFIWCYALIAYLVWEEGRDAAPLWPGHVLFTIGALWSCESLLYCSTIWLPACAMLAWRRRAWFEPLKAIGSLAAAVAAITAYYLLRLGHAPDPRAFADYALAFHQGFGSLPIEPDGAAWVFLLLLCALSALIVEKLSEGATLGEALRGRRIALLAGAWGLLFSVTTYFVGRAHNNNMTNILPLHALAIACGLWVTVRAGASGVTTRLYRLAGALFFAIVLMTGAGNTATLQKLLPELLKPPRASITPLLLTMDDPFFRELDQLLKAAKVGTNEPILFAHTQLIPRAHRAWLPADPFMIFDPLSPERQAVYLARFATRRRLDGWALLPNGHNRSGVFWLQGWIDGYFKPTTTYRSPEWLVVHYHYTGPGG